MKTGNFKLPFPYNLANALSKPLAAAGINPLNLDEASIRATADFGLSETQIRERLPAASVGG